MKVPFLMLDLGYIFYTCSPNSGWWMCLCGPVHRVLLFLRCKEKASICVFLRPCMNSAPSHPSPFQVSLFLWKSYGFVAYFFPPPEPNFIAAYDIGLFTYFFFRENAVEHDCGKTVYSRVARVCKNDIGGRFLLEDTWTTFMKARLNCSRSGEIPFYYNELQSTFYLPEQDLIYGVFTTNVWVYCFFCSLLCQSITCLFFVCNNCINSLCVGNRSGVKRLCSMP